MLVVSMLLSGRGMISILAAIPIVAAAPRTRGVGHTRGVGDLSFVELVRLIGKRAQQMRRLAAALRSGAAAIAEAVYACLDPSEAHMATGDFNHAVTPASAASIAESILSTQAQSILWVGCGHAPECISLALSADRDISIVAIEHTPSAVASAHILLRRAYMAAAGCGAETAAQLDLSQPVRLGRCHIRISLASAWDLTPSPDFDLVYSAAEQEIVNYQSLALFLQALAGGFAILFMYQTMWNKARHRQPEYGDDIDVETVVDASLQVSGENRRIEARDLRNYPMFTQPQIVGGGRHSRASMQPNGWVPAAYDSPALQRDGTRVAIYFTFEDLWYGGNVVVTDYSVNLRYDDCDFADAELAPWMRLLALSPAGQVFAPILTPVHPMSCQGTVLPRASTSAGPSQLDPTDQGGTVPVRQEIATESGGLTLHLSASSQSGYAGVRSVPDYLDGTPRFMCRGPSHSYIGIFDTPVAAAEAYARYVLEKGLVRSAGQLSAQPPSYVPARAISANGVRLHLSEKSSTGYRGVVRLGTTKSGGKTRKSKFFQAKYGSAKGGNLGHFNTAEEAAEAYALHVERERGGTPRSGGRLPGRGRGRGSGRASGPAGGRASMVVGALMPALGATTSPSMPPPSLPFLESSLSVMLLSFFVALLLGNAIYSTLRQGKWRWQQCCFSTNVVTLPGISTGSCAILPLASSRFLLTLLCFGWLLLPVQAGSGDGERPGILQPTVATLSAAFGLTAVVSALVSAEGHAVMQELLDAVSPPPREPEAISTPSTASEKEGEACASVNVLEKEGEPTPRTASEKEGESRLRGKPTARSQAYKQRRQRQMRIIESAPLSKWLLLFWSGHLLNVLRCRARSHRALAERRRVAAAVCLQSSPFVAATRGRAAQRRKVMQLLGRPPRPMLYDVGYDATSGAFSYRDVCGAIRDEHPGAVTAGHVPAYSADGLVIDPVMPPASSTVVLCPERSGAWCYYDTASGEASWFPPTSDTPLLLMHRTFAPAQLPADPPPRLSSELQLGTLHRVTDWVVAGVRDAQNTLMLTHKLTGAVRVAPWVALRTPGMCVFFANLISRETRWLPPHQWMQGWVSRRTWTATDDLYAAPDSPPVLSPGNLDRPFDPSRLPLLGIHGRMRVEGGAPYLHEHGRPPYPPDMHDTPDTYPLDGFARAEQCGAPMLSRWVPTTELPADGSSPAAVPVVSTAGGPCAWPLAPQVVTVEIPERVGYLTGRCSPRTHSSTSIAARSTPSELSRSSPKTSRDVLSSPSPPPPPGLSGLRQWGASARMMATPGGIALGAYSPYTPAQRSSLPPGLGYGTPPPSSTQISEAALEVPPDVVRAASLIARGWRQYVWLRYYLGDDGPVGAAGEAPETAANLGESGVNPLQQPPPFRFLERSTDGQPAIIAAWTDAAAKLLQRSWEYRQTYVRQAEGLRSKAGRRYALRVHRRWLARRVSSVRDARCEIMRHGRMLFELSDLLPELGKFPDV